ncbi:MAG: hypothetical protein JWQ46_987 [Phenylobacterium sp.]|jgi:hypothetical protein|nr:hypothetical protein [Phenylobacterium sp.]
MMKEMRAGPKMTSNVVGPVRVRFFGKTAVA